VSSKKILRENETEIMYRVSAIKIVETMSRERVVNSTAAKR
jgi:hypothetical protein